MISKACYEHLRTTPSTSESVTGWSAAWKGCTGKPLYARLFPDLKGERLYGDDFVIDEMIWIGRVVNGRLFKLDEKSGKARLRLLHVFKLRDGLIVKENVWFQFDELKTQLS
jgi:hypothetical protein